MEVLGMNEHGVVYETEEEQPLRYAKCGCHRQPVMVRLKLTLCDNGIHVRPPRVLEYYCSQCGTRWKFGEVPAWDLETLWLVSEVYALSISEEEWRAGEWLDS